MSTTLLISMVCLANYNNQVDEDGDHVTAIPVIVVINIGCVLSFAVFLFTSVRLGELVSTEITECWSRRKIQQQYRHDLLTTVL